jgi:hypothetical protein
MLRTNPSLQRLDLSRNSIGSAGMVALSEALEINAGLVTLSLADTDIGDEGMMALHAARAGSIRPKS